MEVANEGAETEFFQYVNTQGILQQLADTYPQVRQTTTRHTGQTWQCYQAGRGKKRTLKVQGRWPKVAPPEKVVAFNDLMSWESCPVQFTGVLTQQPNKPPGGWSPPPVPRSPVRA